MDYLDQIKKGNEEILKFLVKNKKELQGVEFTIWDRKKYKDSVSLVKDLIKQSKNPAMEFKIGMGQKNGSMYYTNRTKKEMEARIKLGRLDKIDIEISNRDTTAGAISKFGKSS